MLPFEWHIEYINICSQKSIYLGIRYFDSRQLLPVNVKSISTITISPVVQKNEEKPKDETGNASLTAKQQLIKLVMEKRKDHFYLIR